MWALGGGLGALGAGGWVAGVGLLGFCCLAVGLFAFGVGHLAVGFWIVDMCVFGFWFCSLGVGFVRGPGR